MCFPDFYAVAPVIHTRDGLAELLGAADDGLMDYHYVDAVKLCGHSCPTVASAWLAAHAALTALFPDGPAERGGVTVHMPAPYDAGTTGVMAQVLTLATGAAAENGFHGLGGSHRRRGLLSHAGEPDPDGTIRVGRIDNDVSVAVTVDPSSVPAAPEMSGLFARIRNGIADVDERAEFGRLWQDRVRRLLTEHFDDPAVVRVKLLEPA
jgi:hypothetical protein